MQIQVQYFNPVNMFQRMFVRMFGIECGIMA